VGPPIFKVDHVAEPPAIPSRGDLDCFRAEVTKQNLDRQQTQYSECHKMSWNAQRAQRGGFTAHLKDGGTTCFFGLFETGVSLVWGESDKAVYFMKFTVFWSFHRSSFDFFSLSHVLKDEGSTARLTVKCFGSHISWISVGIAHQWRIRWVPVGSPLGLARRHSKAVGTVERNSASSRLASVCWGWCWRKGTVKKPVATATELLH
jgi:hypothetical protein